MEDLVVGCSSVALLPKSSVHSSALCKSSSPLLATLTDSLWPDSRHGGRISTGVVESQALAISMSIGSSLFGKDG